jgi:hypothetical protein
VKHQRTVALAKDMNAPADEIVKLRRRARREMRDPTELRAEKIRDPRKVRSASRHAAPGCDDARVAEAVTNTCWRRDRGGQPG